MRAPATGKVRYLFILALFTCRLSRFGHVERKDDNDWVKRCIAWEVEGIRQRGRSKYLVGLC